MLFSTGYNPGCLILYSLKFNYDLQLKMHFKSLDLETKEISRSWNSTRVGPISAYWQSNLSTYLSDLRPEGKCSYMHHFHQEQHLHLLQGGQLHQVHPSKTSERPLLLQFGHSGVHLNLSLTDPSPSPRKPE